MPSGDSRRHTRPAMVSVGAVALALATIGSPAAAQDCGSWSRPVVCEADLLVTGENRRTQRIEDGARYRLAPGTQVELGLAARDQRGRRFPDDRLALLHDDSSCQRLLNIDGRDNRLRITADAAAGRCRLTVWVPGNLNFEWDIEFEVDPGARTGYSRRHAEFIVGCLYRAVLAREPDAPSVGNARSEIQRGNLEGLVESMVRSPEFRDSSADASPEELLDRFYQGIFRRDADTGAVRAFLGAVRSREYTQVILGMIRSEEFERRLPN